MEKDIKQIKNQANEFISKGEIEKTILFLNKNIVKSEKGDRFNFLLLVESRYNTLLENNNLGIISRDDFLAIKNKIQLELIYFIKKLDDPNAYLKGSTYKEVENKKTSKKILSDIRLILILILLALIILIFKI